jgi:predicted  nucleic acid-binding Zn-ribbon protein
MFRTTVLTVFSVLALSGAAYAQETTTPPEHPQGEVNRRLERQKDRIEAGEAKGQLTDNEADRLEKHDQKIHQQEKKDRQENGGTLTPKEKKQLNRELNRNSRQIHRARHN